MSYRRYTPTQRSSRGTGKRVLWILSVGALAAAAVSLFGPEDRSRRATTSPTEPMSRMPARKLQTHAADNGILAGAHAAQRELAARPGATVPVSTDGERPATVAESTPGKPKPAIRITRIRSEAPHTTREGALRDAVAVARFRIAEQLRAMDPPVYTMPTEQMVRDEFLRPESITEVPVTDPKLKEEFIAAKLDPNQRWVEIDVEVSAEQVRHLRAERRVESAAVYLGIGFVVVLAVFSFLRLDSWTKGYLTAGLAVTIAAIAGGAVALLVLVR